jgi:hypothetical protein
MPTDFQELSFHLTTDSTLAARRLHAPVASADEP